MRIIITQAEIEEAIKAHVLTQINLAEGQNISINFKNTRGDDGATAEIDITKPTALSSAIKTVFDQGRNRAPAAATEKPVETDKVDPVPEVAEVNENPTVASAAQAAVATDTSATVEASSVQNATTGTAQTASSEDTTVEVGEEITRTVPFDADQPVDQEVVADPKPPTKSLFAGLNRSQKPAN